MQALTTVRLLVLWPLLAVAVLALGALVVLRFAFSLAEDLYQHPPL